jgi:hypothetical protein
MSSPAHRIIKHPRPIWEFKPGIYEHWKGGLYRALMLAWSNDLGGPEQWAVVYVSLTSGKVFLRAWHSPDLDSWTDGIELASGSRQDRFLWSHP